MLADAITAELSRCSICDVGGGDRAADASCAAAPGCGRMGRSLLAPARPSARSERSVVSGASPPVLTAAVAADASMDSEGTDAARD